MVKILGNIMLLVGMGGLISYMLGRSSEFGMPLAFLIIGSYLCIRAKVDEAKKILGEIHEKLNKK